MTFEEWWYRYTGQDSDEKVIAQDTWNAAIAECVRRLRNQVPCEEFKSYRGSSGYGHYVNAADWLEAEMKIMFHPERYVKSKSGLIYQKLGITEEAAYSNDAQQRWKQGKHYVRAPDGKIYYDILGIHEWLRGA